MKVLQLIDSLESGGAERVAVNMANSLTNHIEASYLCVTRAEGLLKTSLNEGVKYLFLNKKSTFDVTAILRLRGFIKSEGITIIHAHSSSFFLATIIKSLNKNVKIVWHDHYGNSEFLQNRKFKMLNLCSVYFNHIFSVNKRLEQWAKRNLKSKSISYLPNFAVINNEHAQTTLFGINGKRIVCLANLREQKDHINLLMAFKTVVETHSDWTLHLIGKDFNDGYSKAVTSFINNNNLENVVFIYGSKPDTFHILSQSTIGVLASKSEGLPLALLEYGLAKLPVIATQVGECSEVICNEDLGILVPSKNPEALSKALMYYIENEASRMKHATNFNKHVQHHFSQEANISTLLKTYKTI